MFDSLAVGVQGSACYIDNFREVSLSVTFRFFVHLIGGGLCGGDLLWRLPRHLAVHFV